MEITIVQALLVAVFSAVCMAGNLIGIYTNRCIVMATGVGIILGDPTTGLAIGAIGELAMMGFGVSQGGSTPPNHIGPGVVGAVIAITTGLDPAAAFVLAYPIGIMVATILPFVYTISATINAWALKELDKNNFTAFRIAANGSVWLFALVGFVVGLGSCLSVDGLTALVNMVPTHVLDALTVASNFLPAIGFAMILSVMMKKEVIPFVILGYAAWAFFGLDAVKTTIIAVMIVLILLFNSNHGGASVEEEEVVFEDGI